MDRPVFILAVDDEQNILDALKRALRSKRYKLFTALTAAEGLELLETHYVDVVIADQKMPGMPGNVFLKLVRERYPDVIRLMLSGHSEFQDLVKAINEGEIFRFLAKPFAAKELESVIHLAFEQKNLLGVLTDKIGSLSREQANEISSVESFVEQGYIYVKINNLIPPENISRILNLIQKSVTDHADFNIQLASSVLSKDQEALLVTMNLGRGLAIKIEFANPLEIPAWATPAARAAIYPEHAKPLMKKAHSQKVPLKKPHPASHPFRGQTRSARAAG